MLGDCILHAFLNFTEVASPYGFFVAIKVATQTPFTLRIKREEEGRGDEEEEEAGEKQNISSLGPL